MNNISYKFGQLIIGPPGCGKTSYIKHMSEFLKNLKRNIITINFDPDNDSSTVNFDIDIRNLIKLTDVSNTYNLGPNGSFLYCMDFLNKNFWWFQQELNNKLKYNINYYYLLIDCPGQVEIFTSSKSFKEICEKISGDKEGLAVKLTVVNLIESINIFDISRYFFSVFSVLNSMIQLSLPQVNFISKCDLIRGKMKNKCVLPFSFFINPNDEENLHLFFSSLKMNKKYKELNEKLAEFISSYGLVGFTLLDLSNPRHMNRASYLIDKANGYIYQCELLNNNNSNILKDQINIAENDLLDETQFIDRDYME